MENKCVYLRFLGFEVRIDLTWIMGFTGFVTVNCTGKNTIGPEEDAVKAISKMSQTLLSQFMVVEQDRLVGIMALKDTLKFLSLWVELENYDPMSSIRFRRAPNLQLGQLCTLKRTLVIRQTQRGGPVRTTNSLKLS